MSFVHPVLVWGTLLGSIPIIIHILSRRRYRIVRWAAVDFLLAALAERSRNVRIQDLVLLVLRVLALVVAALAVARPIVSPSAAGFAGMNSRGPDCVIILDTSYSMRTNVAARTRMALARQKAHAVLASLPERARIGVIYMDETAKRATDGLIEDRTRLGAAIDTAEASPSGTSAGPALAAAVEMLKGSTASGKRILLITDAQARAFDRSSASLGQLLADVDPSVGFVVLTVPNEPAANLAVTDLRVASRWLRVGAPIQFEARLRDFGRPPAGEAAVELWVDGRKVDRQRVALTDREAVATFRHTFTAAGLLPIEVRLDPDAIDIDNHRYAAVCIPSAIEVAVLTGEESAGADDSAYVYIEAALQASPDPSEAPAMVPFALRPQVSRDRLAAELDDAVWAVILADPGALPVDASRRLGAWAGRGGSVLIAAGPNGAGTLGPFRTGEQGAGSWLADVALASPGSSESASDGADRGRRALQFDVEQAAAYGPDGTLARGSTAIDLDSPGVREALAAVNVFESLSVEPAGDSDFSVLLRFTDGRPALLTRDLAVGGDTKAPGVGKLALFTSSLDPSWCDLPYRPAMVPILHDTLLWLVEPRLVSRTILPNAPWTAVLAGELSGLKMAMPDDSVLDVAGFVEPIGATAGAVLHFERTGRPGVYRLVSSAAAGERSFDALHALAVNVEASESDQAVWSAVQIRSLFPKDRCEVIPPGATIDAAVVAGLSAREVWPLAAVLLAVILLAEALLAYRFSFQARLGQAGPQVARGFTSAGGGA